MIRTTNSIIFQPYQRVFSSSSVGRAMEDSCDFSVKVSYSEIGL